MKKFTTTFLHCGVFGWCLEILFTALQSLRRREKTCMGNTSVFMFFIYGMAAALRPVYLLIRRLPAAARGLIYMLCIFSAEFTAGSLLSKKELCPWNYERSRFHVKGLIRLDYAPLWFITGLLFEQFCLKNAPGGQSSGK
ncbi:MAG: hypothetical protein J6C33_10940 [Lachnospiraceae bacterium]|nr:hypothetical protein [Lachnospiraceae bacterium]